MGTIGRALGNSITTAGKVLPGAVNNTSVSAVTALPAGINAGSLVLLSTQTASASASISFTTGIDSTYKEYFFIFNNLHPATDGTPLLFNLSTDNGSNYNVTKTTTYFYAQHSESGTGASLAYDTGSHVAQSTGYARIAESTGADNDQVSSGYLHLFEPSSSTYVKHFISCFNCYQSGDYSLASYSAGYGNTVSPINSVDFKFSSGNIDAGTIQMFGVK